MNRYDDNMKASSPVIRQERNSHKSMPRGVFNKNHQIVTDMSEGWIYPIHYEEGLPGSDFYLHYDVNVLSHNPTFRRLLSGSRIELRTYKRNKNDSWFGWNNFITKGRNPKNVTPPLSIPYCSWNFRKGLYQCTLAPHSPACLMGFAPPVFFGVWLRGTNGVTQDKYNLAKASPMLLYSCDNSFFFLDTTSTSSPASVNVADFVTGLTGLRTIEAVNSSEALRVSALPFVMYNSIVKEYIDSNLLMNNPNWLPTDENLDCILPYDATGETFSSEYDKWNVSVNVNSPGAWWNTNSNRPFLNVLHKAPKRGDYFDSGSPFPDLIRGDIPTLNVIGGDVSGTFTGSGSASFNNAVANPGIAVDSILGVSNFKLFGGRFASDGTSPINLPSDASTSMVLDVLNNNTVNVSGTLTNAQMTAIDFSMNQWRYLAALTVFAERMARCDGSYNQMIEAQFNHNPKWHGHRPTFCGGSVQNIVFSEVVQTSASDQTPLGTTAGRAVSSKNTDEIHVHCDDYCDIITVMTIIPEEYYCQGVDKRVSRLTQEEQYFPIMNNLAPDATEKRELYVSGNNTTDLTAFNYQERFAYYKSNHNRVAGLMALPSSKVGSLGDYVKHRVFTGSPNFNLGFLVESEDSNMKSVYTSTNESEYVCRIGVQCKMVAPIPEVTTPTDMGISY